MMFGFTTVFLVLIGVCVYLWSFTKWHYWKSRGVPYIKPVMPLVGNMYDLLFLRSLPDITNRIYKLSSGLPYVGIYACHTPVFFVRDLDIISTILIKDFDHFEDRGFHFNEDDSLGRNLIHQTGADWKFSRSKLSPCFNVARVKAMLPIMRSKSDELVGQLERELVDKESVEVWDLCLRYTTDVVVHSTLGVDGNSLSNKKDHFREASTHMLGLYFIYHVFTGCFFRNLHKVLRISVAKSRVTKFFHSVLHQILNNCNNEIVDKKNLLSTLVQLKESSAQNNVYEPIAEIDQNFVVAQAFIFFLAGFETPGNILACALYEIAKHSHIQHTLFAEISDVLHKYNEEVTFEALQEMKYLRQVIAETLRMYAPLTLIFRRCTKEYTVPGTSTVLEKGTLVLIPLRSIHDDSRYYPDPENFDPDRFSEETSVKRHIAEFMPFGIGPRVCPAVLYSHINIRMALVKVLLSFEVCLTEKTPTHLQASTVNFLWAPKNGIPLTFRQR